MKNIIFDFSYEDELEVERFLVVEAEYSPPVKSKSYYDPDEGPYLDFTSIIDVTNKSSHRAVDLEDLPRDVQEAIEEQAFECGQEDYDEPDYE
jgi:hypothetical protein